MGERICYLHVGTGKTGSSAIQYALAKAHDALRERGYLYPDDAGNFRAVLAGKPTAGNALRINRCLRDNVADRSLELVERYRDCSQHLVLSCEGFSNRPAAVLREFGAGLRSFGYETKCLVFFRPQADLVVSSYLQQVKTSKRRVAGSLSDFVAQHFISKQSENRWNWNARARKLERAFGEGNVTVKWYPAVKRLGSGGVTAAAFAWLGQRGVYNDIRSTLARTIVNPTPGREALIILQAVNARKLGGKRFADEFLSTAQDENLLGSRIVLDPFMLKTIEAATRESNIRLIEHYCPELSARDELAGASVHETEEAVDCEALYKLAKIASGILSLETDTVMALIETSREDATRQPGFGYVPPDSAGLGA